MSCFQDSFSLVVVISFINKSNQDSLLLICFMTKVVHVTILSILWYIFLKLSFSFLPSYIPKSFLPHRKNQIFKRKVFIKCLIRSTIHLSKFFVEFKSMVMSYFVVVD